MPAKARLTVRPPTSDREFELLVDAQVQSFPSCGQPRASAERWLNLMGTDNLRVAIRGREVLGGLGAFHFGQWFHGRSVPSVGVSSVAIVPEARGSGVASEMMRAFIMQMHAQGAPLSSLYPSTWGLYRKAGYETAGERLIYELNLCTLGVRSRDRRVRKMVEDDHPAVREVYQAFARRSAGLVDRGPKQWTIKFDHPPDVERYAYVVETTSRARRIEGYFTYFQRTRRSSEPYEIVIRDLAFTTPAAGRRILTFLADHGTLARDVLYDGAPVDPLIIMARDENLGVRSKHFWMLRIIDAAAALRLRGYPPGVSAELHFDLRDDLIKENRGGFVLKVSDGRARVRKGGRKRIQLDIRGLASLYTGHLTPSELQLADGVDGPEEDLALAGAVFAGPAPWMNDRF